MIRARRGYVTAVRSLSSGVLEADVVCEGKAGSALCYLELTGPVNPGDRVILNTNAVQLGLGTGGYHFVIWVEGRDNLGDISAPGHIIKARYTPFQVRCLSAEEECSSYHEMLREFADISKVPVVACEVHSMLAPAAAGIKEVTEGKARVAYIMTDGGALPAAFSRLISELRKKTLIDAVITCGHAFGGDLEAINLYSALCVAKACAGADAIVVAMGPGQAGTGTKYGFSGIEQGQVVNAVYSLGGIPILSPRVSFSDVRTRHFGVSHHTITVLERVILTKCIVVLPEMSCDRWISVRTQLKAGNLAGRHVIITEDGIPAVRRLQRDAIDVTSMGRTVEEDPEFFLAPGAAGILAGKLWLKMKACN